MPDFLWSTSQLYLSESEGLESYIDEVLINPNKDELSKIISFLTLIILAIILTKLYLNGNNNFWPDRGVMLVRTSDTFTILDILRGHTSHKREFDMSIYKKLQDKKFAGLMKVQRPVFFVKDIDLAKRILFKESDHFDSEQKFMLEKTDPLIMEMFIMLMRMEWGEMRTTSEHPPTVLEAPPTTSLIVEHLGSKLFSHFNSSGAQLVELVRRESEKVENHTDGISVTECFGRFTMDVIAKACFGVENSCLKEKESGLYKYRKMFQLLGPWRMAKLFISFIVPRVAALFRISFIEQESTKFFKNIVEHTINHRKNNEKAYNTASAAAAGKKNGSLRQDFLQLLVDTRDKQMKIDEASKLEHSLMTRPTPTSSPPSSPSLKIAESEKYGDCIKSTWDSGANALTSTSSTGAFFTDDNDRRSNAGNKLYLTDELILAQSISCFLAEYDTTASHLLSFATYALAVNPECQEKLFSEIVQCLQRGKGALNYNSVNSIECVDMFINETLRMFPSSSRVEIRCTKEYQVDHDHHHDAAADTNLRLPRETLVVIPIIAFHYDEQYFPDPDKFLPERFSLENRSKFHLFPFIPFGYGPQYRSGMNFAVAGVKTILAHLVYNFIIEPTASTPIPMEYDDNFSPLLKPVRMMKLRFRPRK